MWTQRRKKKIKLCRMPVQSHTRKEKVTAERKNNRSDVKVGSGRMNGKAGGGISKDGNGVSMDETAGGKTAGGKTTSGDPAGDNLLTMYHSRSSIE